MRRFILSLIVLVSLALAVSCGKKSEIIPSELAALINQNVSFTEELTKLDNDAAQKMCYLNSNDYSEILALVGTKATCDEIVIITTENTENVVTKLRGHLEVLKNSYSDYRPSEAEKIDSAVLEVYKDTVVLIVSGDSANAKQVYDGYLKK